MAHKSRVLCSAKTPRGKARIVVVLGLLSLIAASYVSLSLPKAEEDYFLLPLLPLGFGVLLLISRSLPKILHRISIVMLFSALTVRYVVSPVLMVIYEAYGTFGTVQPESAAMRTAIFLMIYEMVCIFGAIEFLAIRLLGPELPSESPTIRLIPAHGQIVVPILLIVGLAILAINPPVVENYRIFTQASGDYFDNRLARSEGLGYLALILEWARFAGFLYVINWLWSRFRHRPSGLYAWLSILALLPVLLISNRTSRSSILLPAVAGITILYSLYRTWKKAIVVGIAGLLLAVLIPMSLAKNFGEQLQYRGIKQNEMTTRFIHSYGSPVQRVADSIETTRVFRPQVPGWRAFLADTFAAIPLLGRLTGTSNETTTNLFNILAYKGGDSRDQIVPMIGQSLYHLGIFAAPLYSVLMLLVAFRLDHIIARERRPECIFIHSLLMSRLAIVSLLGNMTNCVTDIITVWLPLILIFNINRALTVGGHSPAFRSHS